MREREKNAISNEIRLINAAYPKYPSSRDTRDIAPMLIPLVKGTLK